jgi:hypothetical protein
LTAVVVSSGTTAGRPRFGSGMDGRGWRRRV